MRTSEVPSAPEAPPSQRLREAEAVHLLGILEAVEGGDVTVRADPPTSLSEPLGALTFGLNIALEQFAGIREDTVEYQRRIEEQIATIETQRAAIRQLSTPVVEVLEGVLCAPMVGVLDSSRALEMSESLVEAVVAKRARLVIIDVTGIELMDTATTDHFIRMARCVGILGAECVLSGVRPSVAQAIVAIGIDVSGIATYRNVRVALERYMKTAGI